MKIVANAAYLSPSEGRVYIGDSEGDLLTVDLGELGYHKWLEPSEFPADLILLYAPGDEVYAYVDCVEVIHVSV
jgi:hypothetical protein